MTVDAPPIKGQKADPVNYKRHVGPYPWPYHHDAPQLGALLAVTMCHTRLLYDSAHTAYAGGMLSVGWEGIPNDEGETP